MMVFRSDILFQIRIRIKYQNCETQLEFHRSSLAAQRVRVILHPDYVGKKTELVRYQGDQIYTQVKSHVRQGRHQSVTESQMSLFHEYLR